MVDVYLSPNQLNVTVSQPVNQLIEAAGGQGPAGRPGQSSGLTLLELADSSIAAQVNTGYLLTANSLQLIALPTDAIVGDRLLILGAGSGLFRITQGIGQQVRFNASLTTAGVTGRIDALGQGCAIELVYSSDDWLVVDSSGNFEVT